MSVAVPVLHFVAVPFKAGLFEKPSAARFVLIWLAVKWQREKWMCRLGMTDPIFDFALAMFALG